jgi:hypothetical protein
MDALERNTTGYSNTASGDSTLDYNTTGYANTASGECALRFNTTGHYNTAIGTNAGDSNTTGSSNTFLGAGSDVSSNELTNATAIGYGATATMPNSVRIGNAAVMLIGGQVAWSNLSDVRSKEDIEDIGCGLDFIKALRPVQFRMKTGDGRTDFGFIAQEIEALLGDGYSVLGIGGDAERTLSLRYTDFIAPMVKAMQEQQDIIETQKQQIDALEARLARLEALVGAR